MKKLISVFWTVISVILLALGIKLTVPYSEKATSDDLPSCVTVGEMRVQLLSDSLVRIEQRGERGFENRPSFNVEKRTGWEKTEYTVTESGGETEIKTAAYTVFVPVNAACAQDCRIEASNGELLWSFEGDTNSNVFLPSPSDELKSWYFTDSPRVIPAENGYSTARNIYDLNGWDITNDAEDIFVFLPSGSYGRFTDDFTQLTGSSEMLPLKLLGFWDSRYYEYSEKTALGQIADYYSRNYPLDVLTVDTDWRLALSGAGYTVNSILFPDMERFLTKAHEAGVSVVFNDHPEPVAGTENLLDKREISFRTENLQRLLSQGLDYWWYDRNWWTSLKPVEEGLSIYASGMYAYHWITRDYYETAAEKGEYAVRPVIMANVDGIWNGTLEYAPELASHRYSLQWTGDVGTSSADLADEIFNAVFSGAESGLPYISADIGGHTAEVSEDMYIRWLQFGALSPICRVHCTKPYSRMPWLFGDTAEKVAHEYIELRYRLLPLYYALSHENSESGLPLVRRLDINYPQYAEADANDEYLLGDYLLVAPLAESYPETEDYVFTSKNHSGLLGEYFANDELAGEPEIVRYDERVNFDWVYEAPWGLSVSDYFSVRWSGQITIGNEPVFLRAFSDDGVRIYLDGKPVIDGWDKYDTYFTTDFIPANTTHDIVIEYCDGNNHAHIFITAHADAEAERSVFIPDGTWADVRTGERFVGPDTIDVVCSLETSPLFVRMGSVIALADNMKNTDEKDWSHLTLEVFPSVSCNARTTVYEDDTRTVAYKSGLYRETSVTLDGGETQTLTVFPAQGSFEGEKAFTRRSWTVRIHGRSDFGELEEINLNGKAVEYSVIAADKNAAPLAIKGAAADAAVYEITFEADISEKSVISFSFAHTVPDEPNANYDSSAAEFGISVKDSAAGNNDGSFKVAANRSFVTTVENAGIHKLYITGSKSMGKLTVRDRAGNVKTISFGSLADAFSREVAIETDGGSELEITCSLLCGEGFSVSAVS